MKRTKTQKGITLIALIITIIVLLILAVVTIGAIQNDGIIEKANNAKTKYKEEQEKENQILKGYEDLLNKKGPGLYDANGNMTMTWDEIVTTYPDAFVGSSITHKNGSSVLTPLSGELVIDSSITSISTAAFASCTGLTSIIIPDSVTSISSAAFVNCTGLTSVTIPNSVSSIAGGTFSGCTKLANITFEGKVAEWNAITINANGAFSGCPTITVTCTDGTVTVNG